MGMGKKASLIFTEVRRPPGRREAINLADSMQNIWTCSCKLRVFRSRMGRVLPFTLGTVNWFE